MELFPYSICPFDAELSITVDLITPKGFGEICGLAGKPFTRKELQGQLKKKDKQNTMDPYQLVLDSRDFGIGIQGL